MFSLQFIEITIFGVFSRFWGIGKFPPLANSTYLPFRLLSAMLNIFSSLLIYLIVKKIFKNKNRHLPVLSSFIFLILPWTVEQGRIFSQPNNALFVILLTFYIFFLSPLFLATKAPTGQISTNSILSLHSDNPTGSSSKVVTRL